MRERHFNKNMRSTAKVIATDMLLIQQDRGLARLVDHALERVTQGLDRPEKLSGYLRGLAAPEPDPAVRAALLRLAKALGEPQQRG